MPAPLPEMTLASPVSAYLQGRAMRMAYEQDQIQKKMLEMQLEMAPKELEMKQQAMALDFLRAQADLEATLHPKLEIRGDPVQGMYAVNPVTAESQQILPPQSQSDVREFKEGDEIVTYRVDKQTQMPIGAPIARAPRYKPGGVNVQIGKATSVEAGQIAQSENSMRMLTDMQTIFDTDKSIDYGVLAQLDRNLMTGGDGNSTMAGKFAIGAYQAAASKLGHKLTDNEIKMLALSESLSNALLQAMRGAQVGPLEQARFDKQLPRFGQGRDLFEANLELTRRNLIDLTNRRKQLRGLDQGGGATGLPDGAIDLGNGAYMTIDGEQGQTEE